MKIVAANGTLGISFALLLLSGCSPKATTAVTLYRNSPLGLADRVHFATFNATESVDFNGNNCAMTAKLLNANFVASAKAAGKEPLQGAGFWCERGEFSETGDVPKSFEAAYPATSDGPLNW